MRDNQRKAVYRWEQRAGIILRHAKPTLSLAQCESMIGYIWDNYPTGDRHYSFRQPPRVTPGRGCRRAIYRHDHVIHLPRWSRFPGVVVHETAHAIVHSWTDRDPGHGPMFVRVYCELAVAFLGFDPDRLVREMSNVGKGERRVKMAGLNDVFWRHPRQRELQQERRA